MTTFKKIFNIIISKLTAKEKKWLVYLLVTAMLSLVISKAALLYTPIIFKDIVDELNLSPNTLPLMLFIGYGMSRLINQIFNEIKDALSARMEFRVINVLGYNIFLHLHKLGLKFHLEKKSGEITRYTIRGTKALETFVRFSFFSILPLIIEVILVGLYFLQYHILYFIIILATIYLYFIITLKLTEWRAKYFRSIKDADNSASGYSVESMLNYTTIKYFNNEERTFEQYKKISDNYEEVNIKNRNRMSCLGLAQSIVISSGITVLITIAGYDVVHDLMKPSDIVLITMYILQLSLPLFNLGMSYRESKNALIELEDIVDLFNIEEEKETGNRLFTDLNNYNIEFKDVSFEYSNAKSLLKNLSFKIENGQTLGIVGTSGAGKTTISNLLLRFYDCSKGIISIGDIDINDFKRGDIRKNIAIVPQDTILFNETIFYNIHYGNLDADEKLVHEAIKMAGLMDLINSLPDKDQTIVGERGLKLSGGEKQRVAIARAILKNPKIFIFDEATSALDIYTEKLIQENIREIYKGKTNLIIAHRLSTIMDAEKIIVLDKGQIVEEGNHSELLAKKEVYAKMWYKQLEKN